MRLLSRFRKEPPADLETIKEIQERVREMRKRIGGNDVELAELFALVREDERPIMREVEAKQGELQRLWPDQVPSRSRPGSSDVKTA